MKSNGNHVALVGKWLGMRILKNLDIVGNLLSSKVWELCDLQPKIVLRHTL